MRRGRLHVNKPEHNAECLEAVTQKNTWVLKGLDWKAGVNFRPQASNWEVVVRKFVRKQWVKEPQCSADLAAMSVSAVWIRKAYSGLCSRHSSLSSSRRLLPGSQFPCSASVLLANKRAAGAHTQGSRGGWIWAKVGGTGNGCSICTICFAIYAGQDLYL